MSISLSSDVCGSDGFQWNVVDDGASIDQRSSKFVSSEIEYGEQSPVEHLLNVFPE